MTTGLAEAVEFADNADPRCPCVLLLDISGSMAGAAIDALNEGLVALQHDLQDDELARRRVEVAVVTFGGSVNTVQDFVTADSFTAPRLTASGDTPMGRAIEVALSMIRNRKDTYRRNGVPYFRPWAFLVTDGAPTDSWQRAAEQVKADEAANGVAFFAVGVEGANMGTLSSIAVRSPMKLQGLNFREMFVWLSQSQKMVSRSKPGEQTQLPPAGWGTV